MTKKGTDLLVIEKEGVADMLMDYANEKGVAILNTRGFLTEYAEDLTKLAREKGCNIATLTDWDSAGLTIASKLPKAYRVGIDEKTLEKLELSKEKVEENVQQEEKDDKHLTGLKKLSQEQIPSPYSKDEWDQMIEYLESRKRIEIDSVIAYVGHENFWNYIMKELDSIFSTRDYNRAIDIPEYVLPTLFDQFKEKVIDIVSEKQSPFIEKLSELYSNTSGFLDVKEEMKDNEKELRSFVDKDEEIKNRIIEAFKKVFLTK